ITTMSGDSAATKVSRSPRLAASYIEVTRAWLLSAVTVSSPTSGARADRGCSRMGSRSCLSEQRAQDLVNEIGVAIIPAAKDPAVAEAEQHVIHVVICRSRQQFTGPGELDGYPVLFGRHVQDREPKATFGDLKQTSRQRDKVIQAQFPGDHAGPHDLVHDVL